MTVNESINAKRKEICDKLVNDIEKLEDALKVVKSRAQKHSTTSNATLLEILDWDLHTLTKNVLESYIAKDKFDSSANLHNRISDALRLNQ